MHSHCLRCVAHSAKAHDECVLQSTDKGHKKEAHAEVHPCMGSVSAFTLSQVQEGSPCAYINALLSTKYDAGLLAKRSARPLCRDVPCTL